eukprot:TRINITY_DN7082_c0_g1_i1.p1 TRINITY_DN7082_c0_g1~~TRINITY_DN7082_c0_g1_i1.p1  ORF type:complete len:601 (+),score=141.43 TRINITY_DN7082_c0_g1_i1:40-1842(+)
MSSCLRCGCPSSGQVVCKLCEACASCSKTLTPQEISFRTWLCNACYNKRNGLCTDCSTALTPPELQYGSGMCNKCYDKANLKKTKKQTAACASCKNTLTAKEESFKTGLCDLCFDKLSKHVPGLPDSCSKCDTQFTKSDDTKHTLRGLCNSCSDSALHTVLPRPAPTTITVDALVYYLETGLMPHGCRIGNIYGRFQAYPSNWDASNVSKGCILPIDRPTTFVLGPDGIEALIGKRGFDMLMAVGLTKKHVTSVVQRNKKYGLVLFEAQHDVQPVPADWCGLEAIVQTHYPFVWKYLQQTFPLLKRLSYKQLLQTGKNTTEKWRALGCSPTVAFLRSDHTALDARIWLASELFCCEPYSGDGWTYTDNGERGVREYFSSNISLKQIKSWGFVDIPVELTANKMYPVPTSWDTKLSGNLNLPLVSNDELQKIVARVRETIPNAKVTKVQRVQNELLYQKYAHEKEQLKQWHGKEPKEIFLFHGTSGASPDLVYNSEAGFDMRFCTSGMWGVATYFAMNASYSQGYSFNNGGTLQMFLASVLVGDAYDTPSDGTIRMPPVKTTSSKGVVRYDSVTGVTGGSRVYMLYCNGRAYPGYLISYTC